ncbi:MAG: acyl transferase, partial [Bacteroidota bacterium]|nr:acyl transferase [Bacteroidota bacterium]
FAESLAIRSFHYQYENNKVYHEWCNLLCIQPSDITKTEHIPFLPISFFKSHEVTTGAFSPQLIFTSSGTTATINSRHFVKEISLYKQSFVTAFEQFYGKIDELCIIGLLPSYLERDGSSLVVMVEELIQLSKHPKSGFYLYDFEGLHNTLQQLEAAKQNTILIGVTYALLDFAAAHPMPLHFTTIMETGGMKGRKEELTREEVHRKLCEAFDLKNIHSEYGMTELLSQAYSKENGIYHCPPWMKVMIRNEDDPLQVSTCGKGVLNIIDLANRDSCAFIATDDAGIVYEDGSFEVLGRMDNSDLRGCSLLAL